jgi:hypothetical protein
LHWEASSFTGVRQRRWDGGIRLVLRRADGFETEANTLPLAGESGYQAGRGQTLFEQSAPKEV